MLSTANIQTSLRALVFGVAAAFSATSGAAQEHPLPEGCTGFYTIQARDCVVSHYYHCTATGPEVTWRDDIAEEGLVFRGKIDAEGRWLESHHLSAQVTDRIGAERDPASLTTLLTSGRDDFDFLTYSSNGARQRYTGYDALTGEEHEFDGLKLLGTRFEMHVEDEAGNRVWESHGFEYVDAQNRTFIGGKRIIEVPGQEDMNEDGRPVIVSFPDDPGFLADEPTHGCGLMMSALTPLTLPDQS